MRHIITILLTATLVLMTRVAFSQENQVFSSEIPVVIDGYSNKSTVRHNVESSIRINNRKVVRKETANALRQSERNNYLKSNYEAIENRSFEYELCIPVVFNIIHDGDAYNTPHNPADEDIAVILDMLNSQFEEFISEDPSVPSTPETGIRFVWGVDGQQSSAIRRFDRTDPANTELIVGNSSYPLELDDWPAEVTCGSSGFEDNVDGYGIGGIEIFTLRYATRLAYEPENTLNVYMVKMHNGAAPSYTFSPWNEYSFVPPSPVVEFQWTGELPAVKDYGIVLNTGSCNGYNGGYMPPFGGNGSNYSELDGDMSFFEGWQYKHMLSQAAGLYLGLLHTYTPPSTEVLEASIGLTGWSGDVTVGDTTIVCDITTEPWTASINLGFLDQYNSGGPVGGWSQCEYHGDGVCDTPWSSSIYEPLMVGGDLCAYEEVSEIYSQNANPGECNVSAMPVHLNNELANRRNVMNFAPFCDRHFFTDGQIQRMHDMLNAYRQGIVANGDLLCSNIVGDETLGCMDPIACNYDELAVVSDNTCFYDCCTECIFDLNQVGAGAGVITLADLLDFLAMFGVPCPEGEQE